MEWSRRLVRNCIACAAMALCPPAFVLHMALFFSYCSSHPTQPDPRIGMLYPLNNHGSYVYLTKVEATGLGLLIAAFVFGLVAGIAVVPKEPILPPRGTPRWLTYVSGTARTDLANPGRSMKLLFLGAAVFYAAVIILFGRSIAQFAVSHGIVLPAW
jgi:hypothetical protein